MPGPAVGGPSLNDESSADDEVPVVLSTTVVVVVELEVVVVVGRTVVEVVGAAGRATGAGCTVVGGRGLTGAGAGAGDFRTTWTVATTWATVEDLRRGGTVVGEVAVAGRPATEGWFGLGTGRPVVPAPAMGATRISTTVMAMTVRRAKAARMVAAVRFTESGVGSDRRRLEP